MKKKNFQIKLSKRLCLSRQPSFLRFIQINSEGNKPTVERSARERNARLKHSQRKAKFLGVLFEVFRQNFRVVNSLPIVEL
jgi:hypothetical protein